MKLQTKMIVIIATAWALICMIVYVESKSVLTANYAKLENAFIESEMSDTVHAFDRSLTALSMYATAWAVWDDAYEFMKNKSTKFIKSNFVPGTFSSSNLNFFLFYDINGELYHGSAFDLERNALMPVPSALQHYLEKHRDFVTHQDTESKKQGVLRTPDGLVMMASLPVLTGARTGPINGSLLMGYYLDKRYFSELAETVGLKLSFYDRADILNNPELLGVYRELLTSKSKQIIRYDENVGYGYIEIKDIDQEPVGIIKIEIPRLIFQEGLSTFRHYFALLITLGLFVVTLMWYLLKVLVLDRVLSVSAQVNRLTNEQRFDRQIVLKGRDELTSLVHHINTMTSIIDDSHRQLTYMATHDPLTGLPNRLLFNDMLSREITEAERIHSKIAVLFIDMDKFKEVNDLHGHQVGDKLLESIARRLRGNIRSGDIAARLSGDEFIVYIRDIRDISDVTGRVKSLLEIVRKPFKIGNVMIKASFSVGVSIYPDDAGNVDELLHHADAAMYASKNAKNGNFCFYSEIKSIEQLST